MRRGRNVKEQRGGIRDFEKREIRGKREKERREEKRIREKEGVRELKEVREREEIEGIRKRQGGE